MNLSIWIGFDQRQGAAFAVTRHTVKQQCATPIPVFALVLDDLRACNLYTRETQRKVDDKGNSYLFDTISGAPMSTEFAISRFLVPHLASQQYRKGSVGWALFMDVDMLVRRSLTDLFNKVRDEYAVMVVKHNFNPPEGIKMDGQAQQPYPRKNWSSVMLFNCDHPANQSLTPELVNSLPGRDLHRFCWLDDSEIGELSPEWNYLVGFHNAEQVPDPAIVHFTEGVPTMAGYENCEYADEWFYNLSTWAHSRAA